MGYLRHKVLIVHSWNKEGVKEAHESAYSYFDPYYFGLITPVIPYAINGGASFFIAPDGSKEGWAISNDFDKDLDGYISWLDDNPDLYLEWALVTVGGDDNEYVVEDQPPLSLESWAEEMESA